MAGNVYRLLGRKIPLIDVLEVTEYPAALVTNSTITVIHAINGCIELIVTANGHQE